MSAWYLEPLLAERLGVTRGALYDFRTSLKKNDWKKEGRQIALSERAVKRLLQDLGNPDLDVQSCAVPQNGEEPPQREVVDLTIYRIFPNPRLLLANRDDTGELVRVKVPINVNFQPRMKIKARPPLNKEGAQLYILEGRCPRFRGRW